MELFARKRKEEWEGVGIKRMHQQLSATEIIAARRDIDLPFELKVVTAEGIKKVVCRSILRLLPTKRLVAQGECDGESVVVKVFLGRACDRHLTKERQGIEAIAGAGVRTPQLRWVGYLEDRNARVLGFEYLNEAVGLDDLWQGPATEAERIDILSNVMITMARLHNAGIYQEDIHLANFLLCEGNLHTIDGGGVETRYRGENISESRCMANLALFFAQFYAKDDELVRLVFPVYESTRQWQSESSRNDRLLRQIQKRRSTRKKLYLDKTFRECTRFVCRSDFFSYQVCERSAYTEPMQQLMSDPDASISSGKLLKDGNSSTVALVDISGKLLVIKRYNIKNVWHGIKRVMRRSRAWASWCNAHRMAFLGIPAMKPVAMMERRLGPLRLAAFFVSEFVDAPDAIGCLASKDQPNGEMEQIVALLHDMREAKISHGDLKASNFLMAATGPVIIDLDGMNEHKWEHSFQRAFGKDMHRFLDNWAEYPNLSNQFARLLQKPTSDYLTESAG